MITVSQNYFIKTVVYSMLRENIDGNEYTIMQKPKGNLYTSQQLR